MSSPQIIKDAGQRILRAPLLRDFRAVVVLSVVAVATSVVAVVFPADVPMAALMFSLFLGSIWVLPRHMAFFVLLCLLCSGSALLLRPNDDTRSQMTVLLMAVLAIFLLIGAKRREALGVTGLRGESLFVDLRDHIARQGEIKELPPTWYAESVTRSAEGTAFSGDFVVTQRVNAETLDVVVVDVSGKGVEAGSRSLFLSGAFAGMIAALKAENFLPAANNYLVAQNWEEHFATAIHLHLHLATGDFELRKAGHPPAVWLHAGSGSWSVLESDGAILGLIEDTDFECVTGQLRRGDGLLLYTDGLVESNDRDIMSGVDRLAGWGARMFSEGFEGGAAKMMSMPLGHADDRALVVVHRKA